VLRVRSFHLKQRKGKYRFLNGLKFSIKRFPVRMITLIKIFWLVLRNRFISSPNLAIQSANPRLVVSMTSYGSRIRWAHLAIESIVFSGCKESDIYLWLATGSEIRQPLRRLVSRGLNIKFVVDQRSHTKYCYLDQVRLGPDYLGFLIADDDMVYPSNWYPSLVSAALEYPDLPAVKYGAQTWIFHGVVKFSDGESDSKVLPEDLIAKLFHPFSGSGLFIPTSLMERVNKDPKAFMGACPTNDDIWLHREFFREGAAVRNLGDRNMSPSVPFNSTTGLFQTNWHGGQNEVQLREAFKDLV